MSIHKRTIQKTILLCCGIGLSAALCWFTISNYRGAIPLAEENLRGQALAIAVAAENLAASDPALRSLAALRTKDVAFLAVVDPAGAYRFHSNPDLIGVPATDSRYHDVRRKETVIQGRVPLGTGEKAYEYISPLKLPGKTMILHLSLHTYQADAVVRKAKLNMTILLALLMAAWGLSIVIYRLALREERHQLAMARQEHLVRLGEMGAMLAHEIRNPLGGIKGFAQVIASKPTDERNRGFAQRIVTETLRLEHLVTDLLAYARSDRPTRIRLRLDELIAHTVSLVGPEAQARGVLISVACPPAVELSGNKDRLGQALLNLAQNALQAMPAGGNLTITVTAADRYVNISVSDNGEGIPPEAMTRIFEPFYTTRARGTGLGLALCQKIVEEHEGTIAVQSAAGQGTTVSLKLPASSRDNPTMEPL